MRIIQVTSVSYYLLQLVATCYTGDPGSLDDHLMAGNDHIVYPVSYPPETVQLHINRTFYHNTNCTYKINKYKDTVPLYSLPIYARSKVSDQVWRLFLSFGSLSMSLKMMNGKLTVDWAQAYALYGLCLRLMYLNVLPLARESSLIVHFDLHKYEKSKKLHKTQV